MKVTLDLPIERVTESRGYTPARIDFQLSSPAKRLLASLVQPLLDASAIPLNVGNAHSQAAVWLLERVAEAATAQSDTGHGPADVSLVAGDCCT